MSAADGIRAGRPDVSAAAPALAGTVPPSAALAVISALEDAGHEAWIVGGWVRDALMGAPSHDVDVCAAGTWEENAAALKAAGLGVIESGTRFGGITALAAGERIEVTTYRVDGFYTDGRHPATIERARSVEEDLARRDFTVNAMAWHPARGLLDRFDGQGDIRRRVIRTVGTPRRRFEEDALRMLRAVRFACRLGFTMDAATAAALASCAPLLDAVARERVGAELEGILVTGRGGEALERYPELLCAAIPELAPCRGFDQHSRYHIFDVYEHTARVLAEVSAALRADEVCREEGVSSALLWAALLHDIGKPDCFTLDERGAGHFFGHPERGAAMARDILRRLARPADVVRDACLLITHHDRPLAPERRDLLGILNLLAAAGADAPRLADELFDLKRADALGKAPACFSYVEEIERMRAMAQALVSSGAAWSLDTLALSGRDLIAAGMEPGPAIGAALRRALDAVMAGSVANDRDELLSWLALS